MSKLHRNAEGQVIQFVQLPRIFQVLAGDLPSGAVVLPNGEKAYWRLQRNISEMKSQQATPRDVAEKLAEVFKALTSSSAFLNHYGLSEAPKIGSPSSVADTFRTLLTVNTQRVEYSTITHGVKKQLVETLTLPFGNQVYLRGTRGNVKDNRPGRPAPNPAKVKGVKGKLWLSVADREDEYFEFILFSPVVHLPDFIREDQLKKEIINKLKNNMSLIINDPTIVFDEGQFGTVDLGAKALSDLAAMHPAAKNGANKKQAKQQVAKLEQAPIIVNETKALTKEAFAELTKDEQDTYLEKICDIAKANKPEDRATLIGYMVSGILEDAWKFYVNKQNAMHAISHPFFLAQAANIHDDQFEALMGDEPKRLPYVKPVAGQPYRIVDGDTLSQIALDAYGHAELYQFIQAVNEKIVDPDQIYAGDTIDIPELVQTKVTDPIDGMAWSLKVKFESDKPVTFDRIVIGSSGAYKEADVDAALFDQCKSMAEAWGVSDEKQRIFYLDSVTKLEKCNDPAHDDFFRMFLNSGILEDEWKAANVKDVLGVPVVKGQSKPFWLAGLIKMDLKRIESILFPAETKVIEGFDPSAIMDQLEAGQKESVRVYKAPDQVDALKFIPVLRPETADAFVDAEAVAPHEVTLADGTSVLTAPLRANYRTALLRLASAGTDMTDYLDPSISLKAVYIQFQNEDGSVKEVVRVGTQDTPLNQFFFASADRHDNMKLNFNGEFVPGGMLANGEVTKLLGGLSIANPIGFSVTGTIDLRDSSYEVVGSLNFPGASVIGFDFDASVRNSNVPSYVEPEPIVISTSLESFLETHDPAKFAKGTRAILTAPDGTVTTLENEGSDWHGTASA